MNERWNSFDALKGLACIAVIFIHYPWASPRFVPEDISFCTKAMMRFAVPVFFAISGFFCIGAGDRLSDASRIVRKMRHVLGIFCWGAVFYQLFNLVRMPLIDPKWTFCGAWAGKFEAVRIARFFLTHDPLFYAHLWFLLALAACYLLMLFVDRRWKLNVLLWLCPVLAVTLLLMQEFSVIRCWYAFAGDKRGVMLCNSFIFRALPFFLFGGIMSVCQEWMRKIPVPNVILVVLMFVGMACGATERLNFRESQFYVGSYLTVVAMILWAIKNPEKGPAWMVHVGRNLSMFVYILHIAVAMCLSDIGRVCHVWGSRWYAYVFPIAAILATLAVSEVIYRVLKKFKHAGWFK